MADNRKIKLVDRLHRGFVNCCVGVTLISTAVLTLKAYEYFVYIRPQRKAFEARIEQELLMEGSSFKSSLDEELKA